MPVFLAYTPIEVAGKNPSILAEIDRAEALAQADSPAAGMLRAQRSTGAGEGATTSPIAGNLR